MTDRRDGEHQNVTNDKTLQIEKMLSWACEMYLLGVSFSQKSLLGILTHNVEKDPHSFLKDLRINNINRLIIGQLNINALRNKFEQLSTMISGNTDTLMISETKLEETFPAAQFLLQVSLHAL